MIFIHLISRIFKDKKINNIPPTAVNSFINLASIKLPNIMPNIEKDPWIKKTTIAENITPYPKVDISKIVVITSIEVLSINKSILPVTPFCNAPNTVSGPIIEINEAVTKALKVLLQLFLSSLNILSTLTSLVIYLLTSIISPITVPITKLIKSDTKFISL